LIRLFTTAYDEKVSERRNELRRCLELNEACPAIDEICVLEEIESGMLWDSPKILARFVPSRPTYNDYLDWISELAGPADYSIIANSDIFFDRSLAALPHWYLPSETAIALGRWDLQVDSSAALFDRNDSQDAWVLRGAPKEVQADFCVGVPRCDNRFLYELKRAGYNVINPAFSIRAYHLHAGVRQEYQSANLEHFVDPPYAYLWPHNLSSLPRMVVHNLRHPEARLSWRLDRRKIMRSLPARAVRKGLGFLNQTDVSDASER